MLLVAEVCMVFFMLTLLRQLKLAETEAPTCILLN